jgi:hypothetical protein
MALDEAPKEREQWSIGITRESFERIMATGGKDTGDMVALWMFYAYTAKWQNTNQPRATRGFVEKGLKWTKERIIKAKKKLLLLNLIEDVTRRDAETGQMAGCYVKVNHLPASKDVHCLDFPHGGESGHKCSRIKIEMLKDKKGSAKADGEVSKPLIITNNSPMRPHPSSSDEMYGTLEKEGVYWNQDLDGNFYNEFKNNGWKIQGVPVHDWVEVYRRRMDKILAKIKRSQAKTARAMSKGWF